MALAIPLFGCEPEGAVPSSELVSLLAQASKTPFQGMREYENFYEGISRRSVEEVASDGEGRFSIQLIESDGMNGAAYAARFGQEAWKTARVKFQLAARHSFLLRDFALRDPALFVRNYRVANEPKLGFMLGRETIELEIVRNDGGRRYELSIDKVTGLALRAVERDAKGRTLSELRYRALDLSPDFSGVTWRPVPSSQVLDMGKIPWIEVSNEMGFTPYVPGFLPEGFGRSEIRLIRFSDGTNALFDLYTDGVETISVHQKIQPYRLVFSPEELEVVNAQGANPARRFSLGPVTVIEAYIGDILLSVIGKLGPEETLSFVESFAPAK